MSPSGAMKIGMCTRMKRAARAMHDVAPAEFALTQP